MKKAIQTLEYWIFIETLRLGSSTRDLFPVTIPKVKKMQPSINKDSEIKLIMNGILLL